MEYVPCIGNSSYSFWWILLKLYRCFKDGLEICILFFQNPEIIFYHFFRIFNLDIFRALILQICIWSIYLVSATPPTVFGESFWNFTVVFRMVWRYAYCFLRILKLFFLHFNLDIFSSLYATDMYREYMPCIGNPAYSFRPILLKLYRYFAAFLWFHMRNLSLAGYNCSGGASCMACSFILLWKQLMQIVGQKWLNLVTWTCGSWSEGQHDLYFMVHWFCLISGRLFDVWTSYFGSMNQYGSTFDLKINVGYCDLYFMVQWFCVSCWILLDVWTSYFGIMGQYDLMFDLKINVGLCDLCFMLQWFCLISPRLFDDECHIFR